MRAKPSKEAGAMRLRSRAHQRFPRGHVGGHVLIGKKLHPFAFEARNNALYFAATIYWRHKPVWSFGMGQAYDAA